MINCKNCNKPFEATFNKGSEQKYCSVKCRQENAQKRVYERIREQVIENKEKTEKPIEKVIEKPMNESIMELKLEIERIKYEHKLQEIENRYNSLFLEISKNQDIILRKLQEKEEYDNYEESDNSSSEFLKTLSGIAPLIIEKLQK